MSQLPLPLGWSRRGGRDELLIHGANAEALAMLRNWPRWPGPCALLAGPPRSGRTMLGALFAAETGGRLVDDAERASERQLFHLWNDARDSGTPLLLIVREPPPAWAVTLPDLRTRLATAQVARITPPDEAIATQLIAHGLARAGSAFAPDVPEFLARRMERCYQAIDDVVTRSNALSLALGQKLSVGLVRQVLCNDRGLDPLPDDRTQEG